MQAYNEAKLKVGCFSGLALTVFVGFLFWISGGDAGAFFGRQRDVFVVPFSDVTGLRSSAEVKLAGKTIGEVVSTRLRENGIADVIMEIDRSVAIYRNATFTLVKPTLIGTAYIQVDPGKSDEELISAVTGDSEEVAASKARARTGFTLEQSVAGSGLEAIMGQTEELIHEIKIVLSTFVQHEDQLLGRINNLLSSTTSLLDRADESLRDGQLETITNNTAALTSEMRKLVEANREQITELLASVNKTVNSADEQLVARSEEVGSLVRSIQQNLDDRINPLLATLDRLANGIDSMMVDNTHNLASIIRSLRTTMENMEAFTARIRANPSLLIFGGDEGKADRLAAQEKLNRDLRDMGRLPIFDKREE